MADNITLNAGAGGSVIATDDDGTAHHQYVKLEFGADNTQTKVSSANPLPVDASGVAVPVTDNGGSLTVDGTVTANLSATDNAVLDSIDAATAAIQTAVEGTLTVGSHAVTNAGTFAVQESRAHTADFDTGAGTDTTAAFGIAVPASGGAAVVPGDATNGLTVNLGANNDVTVTSGTITLGAGTAAYGKLSANSGVDIGDVDVTSVIPGTGATNLGKAEDAAHSSGDTGVMALAVRQDADASFAGTSGDYAPLQLDSSGYLKVNIKAGAGSGGTSSTDDAAFTAASGSGTPIMGFATSDAVDSGDVGVVAMTTNRELKVQVSSYGDSQTDDAAFTPGTDSVAMIGATFDDTTPDSVDEGDGGALRMSANRNLYATIRDAAGNERGLNVDASGRIGITIEADNAGIGGGTQYTEDAAAAANPVGTVPILVRADTPATTVSADGDNIAQRGTNYGAAYVTVLNSSGTAINSFGGSGGTSSVDDAAFTAATDSGTPMMAFATSDAVDSGDVGVLAMTTSRELKVSLTTAVPAGTNAIGKLAANSGVDIGDVDVTSVPTDPFGANADAASATGSISAKLRFIASTGIPITGTVTVGSHAVTNAGTFAVQAGTAAHDAAVSGNPVRIAGRARSSAYTAVASDDTADLISTLDGKQVVQPYSIPETTWSYAAASGGITNTTGVTAKAAAGAGVRNYITRAQIINGHATVGTDVQIRDGASGTVLWRGYAYQAGGGVSAKFDPPLRGTANTLVEVACGTTGSAVYVNLQGYTGV